jgi:hypothetical protein
MSEPDARLLSPSDYLVIAGDVKTLARRLNLHGGYETQGGLSSDERQRLHARVLQVVHHADALTERLAAAEAENVRLRWSSEVPTMEGGYLHLNRTDTAVPEVLLLEWIDLDGDGQQLAVDDWGESAEGIGGWWLPFTRPPEPAALASEPPAETQP